MKRIMFIVPLVASLFLVSVSVAAVTVNFNVGTVQSTTALTGFSTFGDMMDGMTVRAIFFDGSTETVLWADTGAGSGAANGVNFDLTESGDTFSNNWTLTGSNLVRLTIDAGTGDTVFDTRALGDIEGTTGSARGLDFTLTSAGYNGDITATYFNAVALTGFAPVGDLFRNLDIIFGNPVSETLTFMADTDNLQFAGDIQPVPEPCTMLLLGSGLVGLVGYGRRRIKK
jgi:hypothetical protein